MPASPNIAAELQALQEERAEHQPSPEDRASGEYETAAELVRTESAESTSRVEALADVANDTEFPEGGAEAAAVTAEAKQEIGAATQKADARLKSVVAPAEAQPSENAEEALKHKEGEMIAAFAKQQGIRLEDAQKIYAERQASTDDTSETFKKIMAERAEHAATINAADEGFSQSHAEAMKPKDETSEIDEEFSRMHAEAMKPQELSPVAEYRQQEKAIESNLRRMQEIVLELVNTPKMSPEDIRVRIQQLDAMQGGNVSAWDRLKDINEAAGGVMRSNEALRDVQLNMTDMMRAAEEIAFNPNIGEDRHEVIRGEVLGKMKENLSNWETIEKFANEPVLVEKPFRDQPPANDNAVPLTGPSGEVRNEFLEKLERGEISMSPDRATAKHDIATWKNENALADQRIAELNGSGVVSPDYTDAADLLLASKALNTANIALEEARLAGGLGVAPLEAAAEEAAALLKQRQAANPKLDIGRLLALGAASFDAGAPNISAKPRAEKAEPEAEEPPDTNETPDLHDLRQRGIDLAKEMERAKSFGNSEAFDKSLDELLQTKKTLLSGLQKLPNLSNRQRKEISLLNLEIATKEKEVEIRKEMKELAALQKEKKELEVEIAALTQNGDVEGAANAKKHLAEVDAKIAEKNDKIATLRGVQSSIDDMHRAESRQPAQPIDLGKAGQNIGGAVAGGIGEALLNPENVVNKALDVLIGKKGG